MGAEPVTAEIVTGRPRTGAVFETMAFDLCGVYHELTGKAPKFKNDHAEPKRKTFRSFVWKFADIKASPALKNHEGLEAATRMWREGNRVRFR